LDFSRRETGVVSASFGAFDLQRDFVAGFAGGGGDLSDCVQQRLSLLAGDEQCPAEVVDGGLHGIAFFFGIAESGYESNGVFGVVWDHGTFGVTTEFFFAFFEPCGGIGVEFCLLLDVGVRETFFSRERRMVWLRPANSFRGPGELRVGSGRHWRISML
jgi:hypothetical protein